MTDFETKEDILKDIKNIETSILSDKAYSEKYINQFIENLKQVDRSLLKTQIQVKRYKIPFKLRVKNFFYKLVRIFAN